MALEGEVCTVSRPSDDPRHKALHGLSRTLVANMVEGVTKGYSKRLEITGVGYKAEVRAYGLQLALGFSHPIEYRAPTGIKELVWLVAGVHPHPDLALNGLIESLMGGWRVKSASLRS